MDTPNVHRENVTGFLQGSAFSPSHTSAQQRERERELVPAPRQRKAGENINATAAIFLSSPLARYRGRKRTQRAVFKPMHAWVRAAQADAHLSFCSCLAFLLDAAFSLASAFSTVTPLARDTRNPPLQLFRSVSSFTAWSRPRHTQKFAERGAGSQEGRVSYPSTGACFTLSFASGLRQGRRCSSMRVYVVGSTDLSVTLSQVQKRKDKKTIKKRQLCVPPPPATVEKGAYPDGLLERRELTGRVQISARSNRCLDFRVPVGNKPTGKT